MVAWRVETRRRLAALPFRFPLTVTCETCPAPRAETIYSRKQIEEWRRKLLALARRVK